ncbi:MAG TPA: protein-L-isoaspartate(D-aspartate) O-methyltransferase [Thermodesulfobacteriota bacterium]|nr:protein-L-isoaspartate(D-aspartate) O-methyltransferase [Thermodesulfobacteriota bacterium]
MTETKKDIYARARKTMVETQIIPRGIRQKEVIDAMLAVPRHLFVDEGLISQAYSDYPLPIGGGQTISQPFMVAYMTEALKLTGTEKVLEIGTGSGYQAAVLSLIARRVFSIERVDSIAVRTRKLLDKLGYSKVIIKIGDGTLGWSEEAPFDAIIVTAATPSIPPSYHQQLSEGGRLVIPVGGEIVQELIKVTKKEGKIIRESLGGCRFVRLIGKHGWSELKEGREDIF